MFPVLGRLKAAQRGVESSRAVGPGALSSRLRQRFHIEPAVVQNFLQRQLREERQLADELLQRMQLGGRSAHRLRPAGRKGPLHGRRAAQVLVDELHDVVYLRPHEILSVAGGGVAGGDRPVKGAAACGERMMSILDLAALLKLEDWVVEDFVGRS